MHQDNTSYDLDWLAFCYIADELDDQTRDKFELRLSHDQAARQAVVQAMETAQAINAALAPCSALAPTSSLRESQSKYQSVAFMKTSGFLGTAAAILLVLTCGWMWYSHSQIAELELPTAVNVNPTILAEASAWASVLAVEGVGDLESLVEDETGYTDVVYESAEDWMLMALKDLESESESTLPGEEY